MDRRDAIRYTTIVLGATVSSATLSSLLAGCTIDDAADWKPAFFTQEESDFVLELGETMLPRTGTPGAKDAMVNRFIDTMRTACYTEQDNQQFRVKLNDFMRTAASNLGNAFVRCTAEKRLEWLQATDQAAFNLLKEKKDMPEKERPFYLELKEQILAGYFSSEKVAREYFAFDPIPGRYDPCVPYEQIGKAWAL